MNSVGKTTWKLSNCFLVASDKLFSGLVLVLALSLVAAAAWSLGSVDSESKSWVMKVRLVGKAGDGEAIVSTWLCVDAGSW